MMKQNLPSLILAATTPAALAASLLARRRWSFVAGACLVAAVALGLAFGVRAAFVAATLGVVAWFWDERTRLRPVAIEAERERRRAIEEEEDEYEGDEDVEESEEDELGEDDRSDEGDDAEAANVDR